MQEPHLRVVTRQDRADETNREDAAWHHAERASAIRFSESVRTVVALSRRGGLTAPVFRSPPKHEGVDRTIRRRGDQPPVVAIARSGRPLAAVQSDVIEAVVVANHLDGRRADRFRRAAWTELDRSGLICGAEDSVTVDLRRSAEAARRASGTAGQPATRVAS